MTAILHKRTWYDINNNIYEFHQEPSYTCVKKPYIKSLFESSFELSFENTQKNENRKRERDSLNEQRNSLKNNEKKHITKQEEFQPPMYDETYEFPPAYDPIKFVFL